MLNHNQIAKDPAEIQADQAELQRQREEEQKNKIQRNQQLIEAANQYKEEDGRQHRHRNKLISRLSKSFKNTDSILVNMPQLANLDSAAKEKYEESVGQKSRAKKIKNKKSRLYAKDQNATNLEAHDLVVRQQRDLTASLRLGVDDEQRLDMTPEQLRDYSELARLLSADAAHTEDKFKQILDQAGVRTIENDAITNERKVTKKTEEDAVVSRSKLLTEMTQKLLKTNFNGIDLSDDESLVTHAQRFEDGGKLAEIYERMLEQTPGYLESIDDKTDESPRKKVELRLKRIKAVSAYYKVRKMIIANPYYRTHYNHELSMHMEAEDSPDQKLLSKLLRTSFYLAKNLQEFGVDANLGAGDNINLAKPADSLNSMVENRICLISSDASDYENNTELANARRRLQKANDDYVDGEQRLGSAKELHNFLIKYTATASGQPLTDEQIKHFNSIYKTKKAKKLKGNEKADYEAYAAQRDAYVKITAAMAGRLTHKDTREPMILPAEEQAIADELKKEREANREKRDDAQKKLDELLTGYQKEEGRSMSYEKRRDALIEELEREYSYRPHFIEVMDLEKLSKRKLTKNMVINGMVSSNAALSAYQYKRSGIKNTTLYNKLNSYCRDEEVSGSIGFNFSYDEKTKTFNSFNGGDDAVRQIQPLSSPMYADMTDNEVLELLRDLTNTKSKKIRDRLESGNLSPEEMNAEEERFVDAYGRYVDYTYRYCRSVINSLGDSLTFLHPKDLLRLLTPEQAHILTGFVTGLMNIADAHPIDFLKKHSKKDFSYLNDYEAVISYIGGIGATCSAISVDYISQNKTVKKYEVNEFEEVDEEEEYDPNKMTLEKEIEQKYGRKISELDRKIEAEKDEAKRAALKAQKVDLQEASKMNANTSIFMLEDMPSNIETKRSIVRIVDNGRYKNNIDRATKKQKQIEMNNISTYTNMFRDTADQYEQEIRYYAIGITRTMSRAEREQKIQEYENSPHKAQIDAKMEELVREVIPKISEKKKQAYLKGVKSRGLGKYFYTQQEKDVLKERSKNRG